ncbi:hypothetical protein SAMN02745163_02108 [Clostridium cavendishii DSM 21758]|uniref:UPF0122 protein SAMN02745163_02108 n=1 Tax=Clostridium cavendishii DSM 21758 TaxID=1121302 RepID=A0A1M6K699_9CLOT|nr:putative DNA-binding protein [Clostridium cavendishii]SHJ54459.1 hypothetical protein SAMN02745163_02108 [Clostridium cavendishii DSM 21758]
MVDRFKVSILLDYYGCLLTAKQLDIMTMYFNEDLSLAEIAEINQTSRQAIHDLTKRCYKQLVSYEEKLKLLQKSNIRKKLKEDLIDKLNVYSIEEEPKVLINETLEEILNA